MADETQDVFNDETPATTEKEDKAITGSDGNAEPDAAELSTGGEAEKGTEGSEEQVEDPAEPTTADENAKKSKAEKMIPESRLKAALKDVTTKWETAEARVAELTKTPPPDRAQDPDGYEQHLRFELSKNIMSQAYPDYNEKVTHFQKMVEANPNLNDIISRHEMPAKLAYDLAKEDMRLADVRATLDSPEWKEFQEAKKAKNVSKDPATPPKQTKLDLATKVPNLNKTATAVNPNKGAASEQGEDLFKGHHSRRY